jgi:multiple sugar transport system substrate-binding protein
MARRLMRRFALIGCVLLTLAGACTKTEARSGVTFQIFGDPAESAAYQTLIAAFERQNSGVKVRLVTVGSQGDHMTKLATAFSAGNPPDLFLLNYRRFGQFADKGVLEALGPYLDKSKTLRVADLYPQAVSAFTFGGRLTCLPQNISSPVVYYNKDLFRKAGLAAPKTGWTWNDMLADAKKLTRDSDRDGKVDVRGIGFEPSLNRFAPFVWQAGGEVVDDLEHPTSMSLLGAPAIEALQFLTGLQNRHHVVPTHAEAESEDVESRFAGGRLGMFIDSRRATTGLRAVKALEWDVAPLPVHPRVKKPAVMLHSDAYCMAASSKQKDAAFRFVEFAVGPTGAAIIARTGRTVPSLRSVAESPAFLDSTQPPASARVFLDQIPAIRRFPNIGVWHEVESKTDPVIEEWFFSGEPPEFLGLEVDIETLELLRPTPT